MTVKEAVEKLQSLPQNYTVIYEVKTEFDDDYCEITNVIVGINELDTTVIIDNYTEDLK